MRVIMTHTSPSSIYLSLWKKYYSKFFDELLVIEVSDDKIQDPTNGVPIIQSNYNNTLPELLKKYELVMIADVDEIIVPNPDKYKDLGEYMDQFKESLIKVNGFHVLQMPNEKPLNLKEKITEQRGSWIHDDLYDKPILTRIPVKYAAGEHECDTPCRKDNDLVLFHLRDADTKRQIERRSHQKGTFEYGKEYLELVEKATHIPPVWKGTI